MFTPVEKNSEYLNNRIFVGFVEDNLDERRMGRIKVRVQDVFNDIEVDHIPWASPFKSLDGRSFCVPAVGKIVNVIFLQGNIYEPQYIYSENYNINLQNKLTDYSDDEYKNFVALLFDHRTQVYSDDKNLRLDYYFNQISLHEKGIDIHLKDNLQELHLGNNDSSQSAVLGDHWMIWFDKFMQTLLQPDTLVGNFAAPILRPALDQVILEYQGLRPTFLSKHVKIVDNGGCIGFGVRPTTAVLDDFTSINDEKILSPGPAPEPSPLKEKVKDGRKEESKKIVENEPDKADQFDLLQTSDNGGIGGDGLVYGDLTYDENNSSTTINPYGNFWDNQSLTDSQKSLISTNIDIENRKNQPKNQISTEKEKEINDNLNDPYSGFWDGRQGRTKSSFQQTQEGYGTYTNGSGSVVGSYVSSGARCSLSNIETVYGTIDDVTFQKQKIKTILGDIGNGELSNEHLVKLDIFNGPTSYFEENAAMAFNSLNEEHILTFGKPLTVSFISSSYRTFKEQVSVMKQKIKEGKPSEAATPGTSKHGWGIALDIDGTHDGSRRINALYAWLAKEAPKYDIINPNWAQKSWGFGGIFEPWHWEYVGPSIYCGHRASKNTNIGDILLLGGLDSRPGDLKINEQVNLVKLGVQNSIGVNGFSHTNSVGLINNIKKDSTIILFSAGTGYAGTITNKLKDVGGNLNNLFIIEPYPGAENSVKSAVSLGVPTKNIWHGGYEGAGSMILGGKNTTKTTSCSILTSELLKNTTQPGHFCALYEIGNFIYTEWKNNKI